MTRIIGLSRRQIKAREDKVARQVSASLRSVTTAVSRLLAVGAVRASAGVPEGAIRADSGVNPGFASVNDITALRTLWQEQVATALGPMVTDVYVSSGRKLSAGVRAATQVDLGDVEVTSDTAERYLRNAMNRLTGIGDVLWDVTAEQLTEGMHAGESIEQLAARVVNSAQVALPRAEVIARTEVNGAANAGSYEYAQLAQDAGLKLTKEWLAVLDTRTREDHREANGQVVELDQPFTVGGWPMKHPGDPDAPGGETINCRCDVAYDVEDDVVTAALDADPLDGVPNAEGVDEDVDTEDDGDDDSDTDVTAAQAHTGAMVALIPSEQDLVRLALPGGESADELHLTLFYLGDAAQYDDAARQLIVQEVQEAVLEQHSIMVTGFGVAVWNPLGTDPALVMNVGGPGLEEAHECVGGCLDELWCVNMPTQHEPWSPHICLAYAPDPSGMVGDALARVGPVTLDRVRVVFADQVTDIPLGYTTVQMSLDAGVPTMQGNTVALDTTSPTATGTEEGDSVGAIGQTNLPGAVPANVSWSTELATLPDGQVAEWEGILVVEGLPTGDGRQFAPGSLTWAEPWLPLRWAPEDFGEHVGAVDVARIDQVWRDETDPNVIRARGVFNVSDPIGLKAYQNVDGQMLRGVSVDVDSVKDSDVELIFPDDVGDGGDEADPGAGDDGLFLLFGPPPDLMIFHAGRIRGATLVSLPAFVEAQINTVKAAPMPGGNGPMKPMPTSSPSASGKGAPDDVPANASVEQIVAELGRILTDASAPVGASLARRRARYDRLADVLKSRFQLTAQPFSEDALSDDVRALVACGGTDGYVAPPAWMFQHVTDQPVRLGVNVADDGRHIFGYAALWGTCHIGHPDVCVTAPEEQRHDHYLLGEVLTSDGKRVSVGTVTLGTGHAPLHGINARQAVEHYDNTGTAVADVVTGNDEYGIWFAGAIRHGTPAGRVAELRAAKLSGDWRRIGGQMRLVALLAVNVPGFAVPHMATRVAHGQQLALVAAGLHEPEPTNRAVVDATRALKERIAARIGRDTQSRREALRRRVHAGG